MNRIPPALPPSRRDPRAQGCSSLSARRTRESTLVPFVPRAPSGRCGLLLAGWLLLGAVLGPGPATSAQAQATTRAPARARTVPVRPQSPIPTFYAKRPEVMRQCQDLAQQFALSPQGLCRTLGQARRLPQVEQLMRPAPVGVAKNWAAYRSRFVEPVRIQAGVRFWQAQRHWLALADERYGVPPEIVVGILGVETLYGQHMGRFKVLDALATLAFDFPLDHPRSAERQAFFRSELGHFLQLGQQGVLDVHSARGSYAGAMGMPQFMPSSWARFAVDFDGDGRIDLQRSTADAIGSVAHYFQAYGWRPGLPTHFELDLQRPVSTDASNPAAAAPVQALAAEAERQTSAGAPGPDTSPQNAPSPQDSKLGASNPGVSTPSTGSTLTAGQGLPTPAEVSMPVPDFARLLAPDILPSFSPARLREMGLVLPLQVQGFPGLLALVELHNGEQPDNFVLGTENFYAITRYNWSSYYAMAVIELGRAVRQALP